MTDEQPGRIDRVVQELTGRSRADVRGLFDQEGVLLNGATCSEPGTTIAAGDVLVVRHNPHMRYHERPRARGSNLYRLVFEDEDLMVVDKAAGVLTVPTDRGDTRTLVDALGRHLGRKGRNGRVGVVHRLDRDTSGLLVFAKSPGTARALREEFRTRKAERRYAAIVAGSLTRAEGTFASRLGTTKSLQRYSVRDSQQGEEALTHYRVERALNGATLVHVWLETGRRNQIRVHFAEAGHPVLGDPRYRPDLSVDPNWKTNRLALHGATLGFEHPRTCQLLRFDSPLPNEFDRFLSQHGR